MAVGFFNKQKNEQEKAQQAVNTQTTQTAGKSAYQQNLSQPTVQPKQRTTRDVMADISTIYNYDRNAGQTIFNQFRAEQLNPNSQFYNPYSQATNRAVSNLAALGFDTNNLNDNWWNQNQGWVSSNLIYNGTTNTPSSAKKGTWEQKVAYELYQWSKSEETTKKAEQQWNALQEELTYWAQDPNRNYSDEEILKKIDWSKYSELTKMDENKYISPTELNRAIGYSEDAMYGVLWKARNPDVDCDLWYAMGQSAVGAGNKWVENPDITARLNVNDPDTYAPYTVGSTLDEVCLYYNQNEFTKDWLLSNKPDGTDETATKMWNRAWKAEEFTEEAEAELEKANKWLTTKLKTATDPEQVMKYFDMQLRDDWKSLQKLDDSLELVDSLVDTTRAINYSHNDVQRMVEEACAKNKALKDGNQVVSDAAYIAKESSSGSGGSLIQAPSDAQVAADQAADAKLNEAADLIGSDATSMEQAAIENGWSVTYNPVFDVWNALKNYKNSIIETLVGGTQQSIMDRHAESTLSSIQEMYDYDNAKGNLDTIKLEADALRKKYGFLQYYGQEVDSTKDFTVNIDGQNYRVGLTRGFDEDGNEGYHLEWADWLSEGNEGGVDAETFNLIANNDEVKKLINEQNTVAQKITAANSNVYTFTEEQQQEINRLHELELQIEDTESYLAEYDDLYQKQKKIFDQAQQSRNQSMFIMRALGMDTTDLEKEDAVIEYLSNYAEYEKTVFSAYSPSAAYRTAIEEGQDINQVLAAAKEGNDEVVKALEEAKAVRDYLDQTGLTVPSNYRINLDRSIAKLERDQQDYEDFCLSQKDDFAEMVQKGKDEEFANRPAGSWSIIRNPERDWNQDEYYQHMANDDYDELSIYANYGLRDIAGIFTKQMTDYEKDTYYYLMGKGEKDKAIEYVNSLMDMSYGVLQSRFTDSIKKMTEQGVDENFIGTNILAILASPMAGLASLGYLGYSAITGNEINPDNAMLMFNNFRTTTREESQKQIEEHFKDNPVAQKAVQIFYEVVTNRLDSAMNMVTFGGLTSGIGNEMLQEWIGAYPMALSAAMDTMAEVKRKGGTDAQAYGMGLISFLTESGTEAISIDNIKGAFELGKEVNASGVKGFLKKWLTQSGISEMVGETANDILGNLGDDLIMGELSDHKQRVWDYRMKGYDKDEADALARMDEMKNLLHTALVSYLSPGMDIVSYTAGRADYYRQQTKKLQKGGNPVSILDVLKAERTLDKMERQAEKGPARESGDFNLEAVDDMMARREERDKAQNIEENGIENGEGRFVLENNETAELQDNEVQQEVKQEQTEGKTPVQDMAEYYYALERAKNSNVSSKSATIAFSLDVNGTAESEETAKAASMNLGSILGDRIDSINFMQNMLLGAEDSGTDMSLVKQAIINATLGGENSVAYQMLQMDGFWNNDLGEQAVMLASTVNADSGNQSVADAVNKNVHEYRVVEEEKKLLKDGFLDGFKNIQDAAEKAKVDLDQARKDLQSRRNELKAKGDAVNEAVAQMKENPTADNQHAVDRALNEYNKADIVEKEYQQHLDKMNKVNKEAQANLKNAKQNTMRQLHEQAEANVQQTYQQRAEEAAQQEARAKAEQEQIAKEQAEADLASGKTQEDEENARIDAFVDSSSADDETKEKVRKMLKDRNEQRKLGKIDLSRRLTDTEAMLALGALQRKIGIPILFSNDLGAADGMYSSKEGIIYLNERKAADGSMKLGQALVEVAMHEITHSLEQTNHYQNYRNIVLGTLFGKGDQFDEAAYNLAIKQKQDQYLKNNEKLTPEQAEKEIIADFAKNRLSDKEVVQRFMDAGMGGKMRNTLHNINQALKNFFGNMTGADRETAENLRKAERAFQKALNERAKTEVHPGGEQFSIAQFAQATNMTYDEKTQKLYDQNHKLIDGVKNKVTPDMIRQTPVGKLINTGLEGEQQQSALDMFSGLMNMVAMLKDHNLVWEIASGTLESTFSALKANSDTQYHDTIDFGTICAKTQAIVNVMSEVMLDRLKANDIARQEGRFDDVSYGLTRDDVLKIYNETHKAGLSVPCPVCYVFSHWMGVPSLLGQMSRFQHDYIRTAKDVKYGDGEIVLDENGYAVFDPVETEKAALEYIEKMHGLYGNKEGVDARKTKINSDINKGEKRHTKLAADIEKLENQLKNDNLAKRSREAAEKKLAQARIDIEENAKNITSLDEELREVEAYNWITQSLMIEGENGYEIDPNFRITPDEILMDMRRTGEFADRYEKNWAYRTSRGAGMGKSILPYSGASLGDIIMGSQTRVATSDNPMFTGTDEQAIKAIESARNRARRQNLIGGQRLQSTSDFRPEWGLDYVMAFLELQAAKSNAQMYTKVAEAVDLFASAGADVNLSIMGLGNGFHEATAEELAGMTEAQKNAATINGKVYVMDFSDVTGMKYGDALEKSKQYDNVQMILVGMNDTHIRLALAGDDIDFVIPWHSSGNSKDVLSQLVASVEETLNTSSDYTNTQSDKFVSRKERYIDPETGKRKTRTVDARTDEQKTMWSARLKILTGMAEKAIDETNPEKGGLTEAEKKYVVGKDANPYLADLYYRFYQKTDDKCYHVALTSAQAKQIFPYEYWQTDVTKPGGTKETADENGRRFIEYCQAMGVVPRFSGVWDAKNKTVKNGNFAGAVYDSTGKITGYDTSKMQKGYWKLLIDRKMYGLDGNYREQKQIDVSGIQIGDVEGKGKNAHLTNSMLPTETSAKYGIPALERQAAEASEKIIRKPFDLEGTQKLYNDTFTDAEMDDMLRQAGVDYQNDVAKGDMEAAQEDVDYYANQKGFNTDDIAFHGTEYFGFTEFDMDKSQGEIFVSFNNPTMAGTYIPGGTGNVREIRSSNVKALSNDQLISKVLEISENEEHGMRSINYDEQTGSFIAEYDDGETESFTREELEGEVSGYRQYGEDLFTGKVTGEDAGDFDFEMSESDKLALKNYQNESQAIYRLYTRPGNQLVIDADGANWDQVSVPWTDELLTTRQITAYAKENGYDSVRINNVVDHGGRSYATEREAGLTDIGAFFNQEDVKSADPVTYDNNGNVIPLNERFTGSPDIRYEFSDQSMPTEAELDDMLRQTGLIPQEETNSTTNPQRQFGSQTIQKAEGVSEFVKNYLKTHSDYDPDTNEAQINRAVNWVMQKRSKIDPDGFWGALDEIEGKNFNPLTADGQAKMFVTMSLASNKNDINVQKRIADSINKQGTTIGQALQARKLYRLMTPEGRIAVLQKEVDNINAQLKQAGKEGNITLNDWTARAAAAAQTEAEFKKAQEALWAELGAQLPVTWFDKLQAWRMVSMLGNPRTHIRNILGNLAFEPAVFAKNKIGAVLESIFLDEGERTKALKIDKSLMDWIDADAERMQDTMTGEAKYSDMSKIEKNKKPFGNSKLGQAAQAWSDFSSEWLEKEDWWFLKHHYKTAMGNWMTANKVTGEMLDKDTPLRDKARAYAIEEAQKATYRDANKLAEWLSKGDRIKGVRLATTTILPFKKTPMNILKRGIEYSPIGLLKAATVDTYRMMEYQKWANGKKAEKADWAISPAQYFDRLSSGLTGVGIAGIGALLKALGWLTLGFNSKDPEDEFAKAEGKQEYALNLSLFGQDISYTIDWLAPSSMPLFVGAALEQLGENGGMDLGGVLEGLGTITEPIWNLSMVDGVSSIFETSQYEDTNPALQVIMKVAMNYANSFMPTAVGQFSRVIDTARRKSFVQSGSKPSSVFYEFEKLQNKTPFSVWNIPYRDHRGNEDRGNYVGRFLENVISPGYFNATVTDESLKELHRLYTDNNTDETIKVSDLNALVPSDADKSFSVNGEQVRLTAEQYDRLDVERKQMGYDLLDRLFADPYYAEIDDKERISMINDVWDYATQQAKFNQFSDFKRADWISRTQKNNIDPLEAIKTRSKSHVIEAQKEGWGEYLINNINSGNLEEQQRAIESLNLLDVTDADINKIVKNGFVKQYQKAYKDGDTDTMLAIRATLEDAGFIFNYDDWLKNIIKNENEWLEDFDTSSY